MLVFKSIDSNCHFSTKENAVDIYKVHGVLFYQNAFVSLTFYMHQTEIAYY